MTIDMTNNRVQYGLLTDEEKAALHEHEKAGGVIELCAYAFGWDHCVIAAWFNKGIYRTVPLPKTQDVIAWEKLPDWVEWVARYADGAVVAYDEEPEYRANWWMWSSSTRPHHRIDEFPGIVQIGTADWTESKQRRPRG
jgi:hypothetical protein